MLLPPTNWLPNGRLVGVRTACGVDAGMPVPLRLALCGELPASSVTVTAAVNGPLELGRKFADRLQLLPAASVVLQPLVRPKAEASGPVSVMLEIFRVALPGFDSTMTCVPLVAPTAWLPNAMLLGIRTACEAEGKPVPTR